MSETAFSPSQHPSSTVVHLDGAASQDVLNDVAWVRLTIDAKSQDSAQAQALVSMRLEETLKMAKAKPQFQCKTQGMRCWPDYDYETKQTNGWESRAELHIESSDFDALASFVPEVASHARLTGAGFYPRPAARKEVEESLVAKAIDDFRARAHLIAQALGASSFSIQEMSFKRGGRDDFEVPRFLRLSTSDAEMPSGPALPMEPGKTTVAVNLSGKVLVNVPNAK